MRFRCWHLWKDYTVGTPGLLGSHLIDVAVWFMNDPLPLRAVSLGGVYVWKESREHPDTQSCIIEYPKGFIVDYSTRLANDYPVPEAIFYGTKGTFDTKSWTARGDGGGTGKLAAPIKVVAKGDENHVQNWLQCIRTRKTPNAPVETGYAHSIASILCYQSLIEGRRFCYDPKAERIYAG
jgi:predicted dehydrogenase